VPRGARSGSPPARARRTRSAPHPGISPDHSPRAPGASRLSIGLAPKRRHCRPVPRGARSGSPPAPDQAHQVSTTPRHRPPITHPGQPGARRLSIGTAPRRRRLFHGTGDTPPSETPARKNLVMRPVPVRYRLRGFTPPPINYAALHRTNCDRSSFPSRWGFLPSLPLRFAIGRKAYRAGQGTTSPGRPIAPAHHQPRAPAHHPPAPPRHYAPSTQPPRHTPTAPTPPRQTRQTRQTRITRRRMQKPAPGTIASGCGFVVGLSC
jgi:hypothetical protein